MNNRFTKSPLGRLLKNADMVANNNTKGGLRFGPKLTPGSPFGPGYGGGMANSYGTTLGPRQRSMRLRKVGQ